MTELQEKLHEAKLKIVEARGILLDVKDNDYDLSDTELRDINRILFNLIHATNKL